MSENAKISILTNELNRRFEMMDEKIEQKEKNAIINQFTQQLINSGYTWAQIRDIIVSSLKGVIKKEIRRKEMRNRK